MTFNSSDVSRTIAAQFDGCQECHDGDETQLHTAAYDGNVEILREILGHSCSGEMINQRHYLGCAPLRLAATGGHRDCVLLLLNHGATVDIPDVKGQTPLHVAVKNLHHSCAQVLLERGADPNGDAHNRTTPLALAAMQGNLPMMQLLLDFEAEIVVQRRASSGPTFTVDPLQLATAYKHYDCLKLLLASGGTPKNVSRFTGVSSPFHTLASQRCGWEFAQLLYEFGICPWVKDSRGRYPWKTEPHTASLETQSYQDLMGYFLRIRENTRLLKSCCRLAVWKQMLLLKKCNAERSSVQCFLAALCLRCKECGVCKEHLSGWLSHKHTRRRTDRQDV